MNDILNRVDAVILSARRAARQWGFPAIASIFMSQRQGHYDRLERIASQTAESERDPGCRALAQVIAEAAGAALLYQRSNSASHAESALRRAACQMATAQRLLV